MRGFGHTPIHVSETNGKKISGTIVKKEVTEKAKTEITRKGTKVIPSQGSGTYSWPADGGYISSKQGQRWGKLHKGIDIARPTTRTITAADHGIKSKLPETPEDMEIR